MACNVTHASARAMCQIYSAYKIRRINYVFYASLVHTKLISTRNNRFCCIDIYLTAYASTGHKYIRRIKTFHYCMSITMVNIGIVHGHCVRLTLESVVLHKIQRVCSVDAFDIFTTKLLIPRMSPDCLHKYYNHDN